MSRPVWQWSATQTARAIREGEISCQDAVESAIERLNDVNARVNAVTVDLSDAARAWARTADEILAADGPLGPLHGVPITIKENTDQAGQANTNGVPAFAENVAAENAPVVDNLLNAGAIVIGRTNTPEFSLRWFTDNPLRGRTENPWKAGFTPGGSSGGAAAAVALGIGAIGHGNDLGGSLRYPAYCCGVTTIRPSLGRIPAYNQTTPEERPPALQAMSVQGPIAREVKDVRLALAVMAAGDPRDPLWTPAPLTGPKLDNPIRVAVTTAPVGLPCDPAVAAAVDKAAGVLSDAGYAVEAVDPPAVDLAASCWRALLAAETHLTMAPLIREHGSTSINAMFDSFLAAAPEATLGSYMDAQRERLRLIRLWARFQAEYPIILSPLSQEPPFPQDDDQSSAERLRALIDAQTMQYVVNLLGLPAAAAPTGLHDGCRWACSLSAHACARIYAWTRRRSLRIRSAFSPTGCGRRRPCRRGIWKISRRAKNSAPPG